MADNTTLNAGTGGDVIASDDITGVKFQRVKLTLGGDGVNDGDVASGNPIPVTGTITAVTSLTNALPAGTNNIGDVDVLSLPALPAGNNNIGDVDIASIAAGDNNIGNVDIVTMPSLPAGTNNIGDVDVLTLPSLPAGTNNIGDVDILSIAAGDNNIGNVDIVTMPNVTNGGTFAVQESGSALTALQLIDDAIVADDAAATVATTKVMMAGLQAVAHSANPDAADANDAVFGLTNRHRIPFMIGGHPNIQSAEYFTSGAQTDDPVIAVVSAGTKIVVTSITVTCSAANATTPSVRIGFGATTLTAQGASGADGVAKIILSHPGIPAGSGIVKGNGSGIVGIGGDGEDLRITCTTPTTSLIVQVDYFTIES